MVIYPSFKFERALIADGFTLLAGVDEAGCGAWAGPVYSAAVILPLNSRIRMIRDSKTLNRSQRQALVEAIKTRATAWAVCSASAQEIDTLNIRQAAFLAMRRAIKELSILPQAVLCDGYMIPDLNIPCHRVVKGDKYVKSIAAASILAKVARDECMLELHNRFPQYGFDRHAGYGTKFHQSALKQHGPCEEHRRSYAPIKAARLGE